MPNRFQVFISYVAHDSQVAEVICRWLEQRGMRCWIAPRDVLPGAHWDEAHWDEAVLAGLDGSGLVVLVYSAAANESTQIRREVERAVSRGLAVLVFRIEDAPFSRALEYIISFSSWHVLNALTPPLESHLEKLEKLVTLLRDDNMAKPLSHWGGRVDIGGALSRAVDGLKDLARRAGRKRQEPPLPRPDSSVPKSQPRESPPVIQGPMTEIGATPRIDEMERPGSSLMPTPVTDLVRFSVTAPSLVAPGTRFLIDIWAHLERHREEVLRRARRAARTGEITVREKGPVGIARGSVLSLRLHPMEGFEIEDQEDTIFWEGEIGNASFPVAVVANAAPGPRHGFVSVFLSNFGIAKLHFLLEVGARSAALADLPTDLRRFRSAFASYASENRDEVLRVVQGLQKGAPDLKVFLDVTDLRSGQHWEEELWKVIPTRDVFYLFWSRAAAKSPWVEKEWRCALESRGLEFIDPAPLEPPHLAPPPQELRRLHFNDWVLAYLRAGLPLHG